MCANNESTDAVANDTQTELQLRAAGPFKVLQAHEKTIEINENGIPEMVSIDHASHAPLTSHTEPTPLDLQHRS